MKQVAQNYRSGELLVLDAPAPACRPGGILVRSLYSLISTGTEMMKVTEARLSLLGKAKARPDQVKKVLDSVAQQGPVATYQKAINKLDSYTPLGYSLCGVVVEVGDGAEEFAVGDVVACAGNEFALHAELNWVPTNMAVHVPEGVAPEHAAFATVGAIAMQGVRRGEPALGETAVVIGLGLIGQLVVKLLVGSGVKVVGIDTVDERCKLAEEAGAIVAGAPDGDALARVKSVLAKATSGRGADHVFLAAGGASNGPVELAVDLARDRATVVDIGKMKLDLPWNDYYMKELDVRFSRSYGPGRYDDSYELDGKDYPAGYVRWTERRNLECFVDLIAQGTLDLEPLVNGRFPIGDAVAVYDQMREGTLHGIGFLFEYPPGPTVDAVPAAESTTARTVVAGSPAPARATGGAVRIGFVGAGAYASSMLLPHLAKLDDAHLATVSTNTSLSALNAQRKFGFATVSTDSATVLDDAGIDAVFVVTRHHSHADFVCRALEAGKAVFVEKPLAIDEEQIQQILQTVERTGNDRVMVGFNRRFAPLFTDLTGRFGPATGPVTARYLVNAGTLDAGSWYLDAAKEGSRFVGEGGHFVDTLTALVGADPIEVSAWEAPTGDLTATLRYADGSLATLSYLCTGDRKFPKETLDVTGGGRNARLDNFTKATVWGGSQAGSKRSFSGQDKGQATQVAGFVRAVRTGGPMPIALDSLVATTRATIAVAESAASGGPVQL